MNLGVQITDFTLTDAAKAAVVKYLKEHDSESPYVRVGVRGGGCSGLSYVLEVGTLSEGDYVISVNEEGQGVIIDPKSFVFLKGTVLDFKKGLMESGFKFIHPNPVKTCGCGESFTP